MWTAADRQRYRRDGLRYPSDLTNVECAPIAPLIRPDRRSPPNGPGATVPICRAKVHERIALDTLTPKRAAAARRDEPAATAATTRSRRSTDSARDMLTSLLASKH